MREMQIGDFDTLGEIKQEKFFIEKAKALIISDLTYEESATINRLRSIAQVPEKHFRIALEQLKWQGKIEEVEYDTPTGIDVYYRIR